MILSVIVAVAENGVIGRDNTLPWHLPEDLKRFKALTMGHPIVMGRKTFESIGKPLPGRQNIVVSRNPAYAPAGVTVAGDLKSALAAAEASDEVFVIGGAALFEEALNRADRVYLTKIHRSYEGDVHFPGTILQTKFFTVSETHHESSKEPGLRYSFIQADRRH